VLSLLLLLLLLSSFTMPVQIVESPPPMESPSQMVFPNGVSQSPPRHARRRDSSESSSESSSSDAASLDTILSSATAVTLVGDAPWRVCTEYSLYFTVVTQNVQRERLENGSRTHSRMIRAVSGPSYSVLTVRFDFCFTH
jgi:hypothetical protein